ncbi:DUF1990 domain-containing protein [Tsukamurella serpentis]
MTDFAALVGTPFTYSEVGATRGTPPADAHVFRAEKVIGTGPAAFAEARSRILAYGMQRGAGLRVRSSTATARPGTILLIRAWFLGPIRVPCRVVYVVDEPARAGFAYGSLPGHPESGEEWFGVELRGGPDDPDGAVVAQVVGFARPGRWFTRLGHPLSRVIQRLVARRYVAAIAD